MFFDAEPQLSGHTGPTFQKCSCPQLGLACIQSASNALNIQIVSERNPYNFFDIIWINIYSLLH